MRNIKGHDERFDIINFMYGVSYLGGKVKSVFMEWDKLLSEWGCWVKGNYRLILTVFKRELVQSHGKVSS